MRTETRLPKDVWDRTPPEAQAYIRTLQERMAKLERQAGQLERQVEQLERQVEQLQRQVKALEEENRQLRERVNRNSSNSSKPPSSDPPHVKRAPPRRRTGRKRGGQPGHPRHQRDLVPPERVKETFDIKPQACRRCGCPLEGEDREPIRHQVAELPPMEPEVTEYRLHRLTCPKCGTRTCGELPEGVPRGCFGPRLQAMLSLLAGAFRLSKRAIQALAADLFGLSISLGMISKLERQTSAALDEPYRELCGYVRQRPVGMDETSWRENRRRVWLWVVVTGMVTVFRIACSRGAKVAQELLGMGYQEVATTDRAKAYNWLELRQLCWAHLRRDFQAMIDRGTSGSKIGKALLKLSDEVFHLWHRFREGSLSRSTFQKYVGRLRRAVREQLERGTRCRCPKTAATCRELLNQEELLWTFVRVEGIEPTNNASERSVRHGVLWRKTSGGTDGNRGSRFVERILSVVATCRQQSRNVLGFLTECCAAQLQGDTAPSLLPPDRPAQQAA